MEQLLNLLKSLFEPIIIFVILVFLLIINSWVFNKIKIIKSYGVVIKNIVSIFIVLIGLLFFIFSFPIDKTLKGQILSFLAIIISAGIALSSTTILGNLIADTVISTTVSLGYDISRIKIEESLKEAAFLSGLTNPYVYISNLGDYAVLYKIHGFLEDSSKYFSTISLLNANVMDVLHKEKIEIVSPTNKTKKNRILSLSKE